MKRPYRPKTPDGATAAYRALLRRALARAEESIAGILHLDAKKYGLRAVAADVEPSEVFEVGRRVDRANLREARAYLPAQLLARVSSGMPEKMIRKFRDENVALIKSLVGTELEEITEILDEGFKAGKRVEDLRKEIRERFDVTRSKADLLATDQVLKLNAKITETRQKQAGIREYTWSASNDERVRPMHAELDGTVQAWSDPPITNEEGDRNHPGEDFRCRCVAIPILPQLDDEEDET